jgi:hypothetical protein
MVSSLQIFQSLPEEIITNNIAPYTYQPKPDAHLLDIRTFVSDYQMIEGYYMTMMNEYILLNDILRYYKNKYGFSKLKYIYNGFMESYDNPETKIRIIWAKLTPNERTDFINSYILIDEEL